MKLKLTKLALLGLFATVSFTGCDDVTDVLDESELASPTFTNLTVTSEISATINFSASNAGDDAQGYKLLSATDSSVLQTVEMPSYTGPGAFQVAIDKDTAASWIVVAYEDEDYSNGFLAEFNPRMMNGPFNIAKLDITAASGQGLQVDDSVVVTSVAADVAATDYEDGGMATFYFENTSTDGVTITPINLSHVVVLETTTPQQVDIDEVAAITTAYGTTATNGLTVYSRGKSPRPANAETGAVLELTAGLELLVVSADKSFARVVIDAISAEGVVSTTVYTPAENEGVLLYKTK